MMLGPSVPLLIAFRLVLRPQLKLQDTDIVNSIQNYKVSSMDQTSNLVWSTLFIVNPRILNQLFRWGWGAQGWYGSLVMAGIHTILLYVPIYNRNDHICILMYNQYSREVSAIYHLWKHMVEWTKPCEWAFSPFTRLYPYVVSCPKFLTEPLNIRPT